LLTAAGRFPTNGAAISVSANTGDPTVGQKWQFLQANVFTMLLTLPPQPYKMFTGDQQRAYVTYVPQVLKINGLLRAQYTNLEQSSSFA
jgi:hypothetical protein